MTVSDIYSYPLKFGMTIIMGSARIDPTGILYNRSFVVIDENNWSVTGREYPKLTTIVSNLVNNTLQLSGNGLQTIVVPLPYDQSAKIRFILFRNDVKGLLIDVSASDWVSTFLGASCRMVWISNNFWPIEVKGGGIEGDCVGYADASPLHAISEASLKHLNPILMKQVTPFHFRPNLVIVGARAYEEDHWKKIVINSCEFEVHHKCKRCVFTTVDPITSTKDENLEPLSTLAKFRNDRNEPLTFGIYLVPRIIGHIQLGNTVSLEI